MIADRLFLKDVKIQGRFVTKHYPLNSRKQIRTPIIRIRYVLPFKMESLRWSTFETLIGSVGVYFLFPNGDMCEGIVIKKEVIAEDSGQWIIDTGILDMDVEQLTVTEKGNHTCTING